MSASKTAITPAARRAMAAVSNFPVTDRIEWSLGMKNRVGIDHRLAVGNGSLFILT